MINQVIAKTSTSKKVVDFRDGLVLAKPEDYAMLFGVGGKKHNAVSVIKVTLCDFSAGTGEGKSITCDANLGLDVIALLYAVAKDRLVNPVKPPAASAPQPTNNRGGVTLSEQSWNELQNGLAMLRNTMKANTGLSGDALIELGMKLRAICDDGAASLAANAAPAPAPAAPIAYGKKQQTNADFTHQQVRVHSQRQGQDGLAPTMAPVQKLTITHTAYDANGNPVNYPWIISIANGAAEPRISDTGAITYKSSTYQEINNVFMNISDMDMFRMMNACQRFITTFTMCYGIPLVKNGVETKQREREEWLNNQQGSGGSGYAPQYGQTAPAQPAQSANPQVQYGKPQNGYVPQNQQANTQPAKTQGGYVPQGQQANNPPAKPQGGYVPQGGYAPQNGNNQQQGENPQYGRPQQGSQNGNPQYGKPQYGKPQGTTYRPPAYVPAQ